VSSSAGVSHSPAALSDAQTRIIVAAVELFARHGVGGTSLQMIADEIGVTKAAVYHQYKTKDEIVLAAAEAELDKVRAVVDAAEQHQPSEGAREALISGMVELAIEGRRTMSTVLSDPVIVEFFADHRMFRDVMHRLRVLLVGDDTRPETRVQTAMLIAAISGAVMHPFVVDVDDDTLRAQLQRLARGFLALPS
jgi:AcrR family transcriptional regulator